MAVFTYDWRSEDDPLENDRRRRLYEAIADEPGLCLSAVSERSDVALSTARYHLRVLEDRNAVRSVKVNGKRRYVPEGASGTTPAASHETVDPVELRGALAEPARRQVIETLADLGRAHNGRLADELDRDPSTVSHHLSALEDDGLVVREREGRTVINELAPVVETALLEGDADASRSGRESGGILEEVS